MKILCVVFVVLSLTSVSQSASLACKKLLEPLDQGPDFSGRWYVIALSASGCFFPTLFDVLWPSLAFDVTKSSKPNIYGVTSNAKMFGYCDNETLSDFHGSNVVYEVDDEKDQLQLLQSGCPDCIVMQSDDLMSGLILLSRRPTITAAEMKEFETQMNCLGWSVVVMFNTDHAYDNCRDPGASDQEAKELEEMILERMAKTKFLQCFEETVRTFFQAVCDAIKDAWNSLW